MKIILFAVLALIIPLLTQALDPKETKPPRRKLPAGAQVSITEYIPASDVFLLTLTRAHDVGPNYAASEDLKAAIGMEGSVKDFVKKQSRDLGSEFTLKKPLPLLWDVELQTRAKKLK